jgi:hypothetical protein
LPPLPIVLLEGYDRSMSRRTRIALSSAACALLLGAHLLTLGLYPPMHADEAWLAAETRSMVVSGSVAVGADFYHVTPFHPHAIRLLFHFLQVPFVAAKWSLESIRLLSLAFALSALVAAFAFSRRLFGSGAARFLFVAGLAIDPALFAAAHLARPEIVLVAAMLCAFALSPVRVEGAERRRARTAGGSVGRTVAVASVVGLSIGLHANAFIVACAVGALYLTDLLTGCERPAALKRLLVLIAVVAIWALGWVVWSRALSPDFPRAYAEFGNRYGVGESLLVKALGLPDFYRRLFGGAVGTYFVPDLRLVLGAGAVAVVAGVALAAAPSRTERSSRRAKVLRPISVLVAVNVAMVAIGKYSSPTAVFLAPGIWWLLATLFDTANRTQSSGGGARIGNGVTIGDGERAGATLVPNAMRAASVLLIVAVATTTAIGTVTVAKTRASDYRRYIEGIRAHTREGASVLAGPNTAFAFGSGRLHAYNDLAALHGTGLSLEEYIRRYRIEYVLVPDELELIYSARPVYNDLYGNPSRWYPELVDYLESNGEIVAVLDEPVYAMRLIPYQSRPSELTIYRVR